MNTIKFDSINEGDFIPQIKKDPVTQVQLIRYAGASGDFNQIHTVPQYAIEAGLPGTIVHGMLVMGILGQAITAWIDPSCVAKYAVSFKAMTMPGDVLTAKGQIQKKYEKDGKKMADCNVWIEDEKAEVKIEGKLSVICV
jgi:acyl dehydratase